MPVRLTSRYNGIPVYTATDARGITHATVAIRPPAPPAAGTVLYQHPITAPETLDYLAWRYYGSSDEWWRIAEANPTIFPLELVPGRTLSIPATGDRGQVVRSRRF